jgi:AraC family transcriptional regulator, ethanolamine operon transcriptional activator
MMFRNLSSSIALTLDQYVDIDQFRESERYVHAESVPLKADQFFAARASLKLPSCTLSLVHTFPRIINGYDMANRLVVVVPMDGISSARVNGETIGQCLLLLKGAVNCTIHEPEGRLVAILSAEPEAFDCDRLYFDDGYLLVQPPTAKLARLQTLIQSLLEFAADAAAAIRVPDLQLTAQASLLEAFNGTISHGHIKSAADRRPLGRYKEVVDRMDDLFRSDPTARPNCEWLADEMGISARTLQTAVRCVCGLSPQSYVRLRRLWSVRRQLRTGAPALTVKASALANGFVHMGEFSDAYRRTFGELPSETLGNSRRRST